MRTLCPKCRGDSTKELSLVVRGDWFKCYRASCGWSSGGRQPERTYEPVRLAHTNVDVPTAIAVAERYNIPIDYSLANLRQIAPYRIAIPVINADGVQYGWELRNVVGKKQSRLLLSSAPLGNWRLHGKKLVVVEDPMSMIRLDLVGVSSCCMTGTTPPSVDYGRWDTVLAMDKDASHKCVRTAPRIGARPALLCKDIKDMTDEELQDWLGKWEV